MIDLVLFYVAAAIAIASALGVILQRNPAYAAFSLIVTLCSLSVCYGLLGSPFIAVLQIVVYAGAIMVLFLFVIMLLNVKREDHPVSGLNAFKGAAGALAALLVLQVGTVLLRVETSAVPEAYDASTRTMAQQLFKNPSFLYVFEATSVLILAALVGAIVLAKKDAE
jgi:NADH-quinone oxidoreductase subunit J